MPTSHCHTPRRIDLHLHTNRSDGKFSPEEVIQRCARAKLDLIALTDHDITNPKWVGTHIVDEHQIRVIAAAEISGVHDGIEFHLLAYFPGHVPDEFATFCRSQTDDRLRRYLHSQEMLDLPKHPLLEHAKQGEFAITRYHVAQQLIEEGRVNSIQAAFDRYIAHRHPAATPVKCTYTDAIQIVRDNGGITSWAHPSIRAIQKYLPDLAKAGLQGLEGFRPAMNAKYRKIIRKAAKNHDLFLTGGSDWHGWQPFDPGLFYVEPEQVSEFLQQIAS